MRVGRVGGLLAATLAMVALSVLAPRAQAQDVSFPYTTNVHWLTGVTDSAFMVLGGSVQKVDTSAVIYTPSFDETGFRSIINSSAVAIGRVWVTGSAQQNCDTLFYAIDISPDGGTTWQGGAFNNLVLTNATDVCASAPIAIAPSTNVSLYCVPCFRIRVRPDGNTNAAWVAAKLYLSFYKRASTN